MPAGDLPPPTKFELQLSQAIDPVYGGGSGTRWEALRPLLASGVGLQASEVGLISVTEAAVVNNRPLSAGLITSPRRLVIILVADEVGLARQEQAIVGLMPKTRHLTTVGIATRVSDHEHGPVWRVQRLIEIEGLGIADDVRSAFPAVQAIRRTPLVPFGQSPAETGGSFSGTVEVDGARVWFVEDDEPADRHSTCVEGAAAKRIRVGDQIVLGERHEGAPIARSVAMVRGVVQEGQRLRLLLEDRQEVEEEYRLLDIDVEQDGSPKEEL